MLKPKKGRCKDCNRETLLIAGRCKTHYWLYRKSLKKEKSGRDLLSFYKEIWQERQRLSYLSGEPLYEFNVSCFAHVVRKSRRSDLIYNKENIVLLTPYEHHLFDNGTHAQREIYAQKKGCNWLTLYDLQEILLTS